MGKDIQEIRGKGKGLMATGGRIGLWGLAVRIWASDCWMGWFDCVNEVRLNN